MTSTPLRHPLDRRPQRPMRLTARGEWVVTSCLAVAVLAFLVVCYALALVLPAAGA